MAYYGLVFGSLPGDILTVNIVNAVMELSLMPLCIFLLNFKSCSRKLLCAGLYFGTAFCVGGSALFQYLHIATLATENSAAACIDAESTFTLVAKIFTFAGRATVGAVFAVLYVFTGDLFPTGIRGHLRSN